MGWVEEFGAAYQVPAEIAQTLVDESWHNDVCPSFSHPEAEIDSDDDLRLWVEHPDPAMREWGPDLVGRYLVVDIVNAATRAPELVPSERTDDLSEALAVLARYAAIIKARRVEAATANGGSTEARCPFCDGAHVLMDCPNIDPEQLAEEQGCPECERSYGPSYRGVCRHGA
jgi:hypothetical protein